MENKTRTLVLNGVAVVISTHRGVTKIMTHATSDAARLEPLIKAIEGLQTKEDKEETVEINKFEDFLNSLGE